MGTWSNQLQARNFIFVSIQLVSPASGDKGDVITAKEVSRAVSIQLVSPASGDDIPVIFYGKGG